MQNCMIFNFYFINFFQILTFKGPKSHFWFVPPIFLIFFSDFPKKGLFWAFKVKILKKSIKQKLKIMQFYYRQSIFLILLPLVVAAICSLRSVSEKLQLCRKVCSLWKKAVGSIATLNVGRIATLSVGRTEVHHSVHD